jgi:hypothetical protein
LQTSRGKRRLLRRLSPPLRKFVRQYVLPEQRQMPRLLLIVLHLLLKVPVKASLVRLTKHERHKPGRQSHRATPFTLQS